MSALGGPPRRIAAAPSDFPSTPQWSSDGSSLAYVAKPSTELVLTIQNLESKTIEVVEIPGEQRYRFDLALSPGGRFAAYVDAGSVFNDTTTLGLVRLSDGHGVTIASGPYKFWSPTWSTDDDGALHYVSNRGGTMDLWRQELSPEGEAMGSPQPITSGVVMQRASFSPDGTRLSYSRGRQVGNIWRVPLASEQLLSWENAEQLTFDEAKVENIDASPDGRTIVFDSDRGGTADLWTLSLDDYRLTQLTTHAAGEWAPAWSPDQSLIAFYSNRTGNYDIWILPVDGGAERQVTRNELWDFSPSWSPDGEKLAIYSNRDGAFNIWIKDLNGEVSRLTTDRAGGAPAWSPDGLYIAAVMGGTGRELALVDVNDGKMERLTSGIVGTPVWAPDGSAIYFVRREERTDAWSLSVETREERTLTDFSGRRGRMRGLETDGRHLYFAWEESFGDIWFMDVVTNPSQ